MLFVRFLFLVAFGGPSWFEVEEFRCIVGGKWVCDGDVNKGVLSLLPVVSVNIAGFPTVR